MSNFIEKLEKNSFEMDVNKINTDFSRFCYYGGFLADENIPKYRIMKFIESNKKDFEILAMEHIKKISSFKEGKIIDK